MDLLFLSPPRISAAQFARVLAAAHSPASPDAPRLYAIPVRYGLDPALALAFFAHESTYGTRGRAVESLNWGNLRKGQGRAYKVQAGFAYYRGWADSLEDWCSLIVSYYIAEGLDTVRKAIPVYAPSSDRNKPERYIGAVLGLVAAWQAQDAPVDVWASWGDAAPLHREWAIPQRWAREGNLGRALGGEVYAPDGLRAVQWFERGAVVYLGDGRTEVIR